MKIISSKMADSFTWAELKATRKLLDTKQDADLFTGKKDGIAVAMIPTSANRYHLVVIEFDPLFSEELFKGYGVHFDVIVSVIWNTIDDFFTRR